MSSQEDLKYTKKYLKYKAKYLALAELEQNGGGIFSKLSQGASKAAKASINVARTAVANPELRQTVKSVATNFYDNSPELQAAVAQGKEYLRKSPNMQLASQIIQSNPTVKAMLDTQSPDSIWYKLSAEQKQKLIELLPSIQ